MQAVGRWVLLRARDVLPVAAAGVQPPDAVRRRRRGVDLEDNAGPGRRRHSRERRPRNSPGGHIGPEICIFGIIRNGDLQVEWGGSPKGGFANPVAPDLWPRMCGGLHK